jgi:hypothetical protein
MRMLKVYGLQQFRGAREPVQEVVEYTQGFTCARIIGMDAKSATLLASHSVMDFIKPSMIDFMGSQKPAEAAEVRHANARKAQTHSRHIFSPPAP